MTPAETFAVDQLAEAIKANDADRVHQILDAQLDLVRTDMAYENEHQVLHYAVYATPPLIAIRRVSHTNEVAW